MVLGLVACRTVCTPPPVDLSAPGWTVRQGQAVWRSNKQAPEIAGELLVATRQSGGTFLQFTKTPLPFVVAQTTSNAWRIEFAAEHKVFSGCGKPPQRLGWLQLARCFAGNGSPPKWSWQRFEGGRWRLTNRVTGEMLEGYLTP